MRRNTVLQSDLPKNARAVFERKVAERAKRCGDCLVTAFQPSTARPAVVIGGLKLKAHQWAYVIYRGGIPAGMNVCHSCDVARCVNPDHLWLGTQADNIRDMDAKGRRGCSSIRTRRSQRKRIGRPKIGGLNHNAKLTEDQARLILAMRNQVPMREVAALFGVHPAHIRNIWTGARWAHLQSA